MFYTYAHYKPEGGIFYIGKGVKRRAYEMTKRNMYWNNVVNKYGKPYVEILANWKTEIEAFDHEKLLIASFKDMGVALVNLTDGGEGPSGSKHSEETKLKLSILKKGKPSPNKGVPMSEEQKLKLRLANLGKPATRKGAKHTPEAKAKMRAIRNKTKMKLLAQESLEEKCSS